MKRDLKSKACHEFYEECWRKVPFDEIIGQSSLEQRRVKETIDIIFRYLDPTTRVILDVGTGTGIIVLNIAKMKSNLKLISLDIAYAAISKLVSKATYYGQKLLCVVGEACDLPLSQKSVDAVIACEVIEHVVDSKGTASELIRVLRPGGVVVATVPNSVYVRTFSFYAGLARYLLYRIFGFQKNRMHDCQKFKEYEKFGVKQRSVQHGKYTPRQLASLFRAAKFQIVEVGSIVEYEPCLGLFKCMKHHTNVFRESGMWSFVVAKAV